MVEIKPDCSAPRGKGLGVNIYFDTKGDRCSSPVSTQLPVFWTHIYTPVEEVPLAAVVLTDHQSPPVKLFASPVKHSAKLINTKLSCDTTTHT